MSYENPSIDGSKSHDAYGTPMPRDATPYKRDYPTPTNPQAIISLCTAFVFPILAIIFGIKARRRIAETGEAGIAYANWGLGIGIVAVVFAVGYLILVGGVILAGLGSMGDMGSGMSGV